MSESIVTSKTLENGYRVNVRYDTDPTSPREWDNAGTVALVDSLRYDFGDEKKSRDEIAELINDPDYLVLPVYMYDHSGITIKTSPFSCSWDSGQAGIIYISKSDAVKEWGKKILTKTVKQKALDYLKGEIETLDQYITGTVYGYDVLNENGDSIDSCFGFYGESEECLTEGVSVANALHPNAGQMELNLETEGA